MTKPSLHSLLLIVLATAVAGATPVAHSVDLTVNGKRCDDPDAALLVGDHLYIASSVLISQLGLKVAPTPSGLWRISGYTRSVGIRPDTSFYKIGDDTRKLSIAPFFRGSELYVPAQMILATFELTLTPGKIWSLRSTPAEVLAVRQGSHKDRVRFVIDLSASALFSWYEQPGRLVLEIPTPVSPSGSRLVQKLQEFRDDLAPQVSLATDDQITRLTIYHYSGEPPVLTTLLDQPRVVVDLYRAPQVCPAGGAPTTKPKPGDIWGTNVFLGRRGPVRGFVMRFDPRRSGYSLRPALAGATIMQRARVSRIAQRAQAYGAINGGFFSLLGPPLGMLVIDGEWIKAPLYNRAVFGIDNEGQCDIRRVGLSAHLEFEGIGPIAVESINEGHLAENSVVVYTQRWGPTVEGAPGRTRLVVDKSRRVVSVLSNGEGTLIPQAGLVISGFGTRAQGLKQIPIGTRVSLKLDADPSWPGLKHAVGGGPLLVSGGQVTITAADERFRGDITSGSRPRTALGITSKGTVILLAVQSPGLTLTELAKVLIKLGARRAMNLDGGGSTAIVVGGRVLNCPSDGCERAVSNALLVIRDH